MAAVAMVIMKVKKQLL